MDLDIIERDYSTNEQGETVQSHGAPNIVAKPNVITGRMSREIS